MKRFPDLRQLLNGQNGADLLLWLTVAVPVFVADAPPISDDPPGIWQPADLPLGWARVAAALLLGLAVAVSRRHPVAAAAVPVGLGLAANPELFTNNFVIAQLLLAFLLGRRTSRSAT